MGAQGTADLDFGAFPGKSDASVDVVAAGVISTSLVEAWIRPVATADHTADEHMVETLKVFGTYLSDGNLRIYGFNTSELNEPVAPARDSRASLVQTGGTTVVWQGVLGSGIDAGAGRQGGGGKGTRLYGIFKVAWVWN